jgi:hypothetical protein
MGLTMMNMSKGWEPTPPQHTTLKPRLERQRSELPRGGKDLVAQIGAELRAVFAPVPPGRLAGVDELLSQIDGWRHESWNGDRG